MDSKQGPARVLTSPSRVQVFGFASEEGCEVVAPLLEVSVGEARDLFELVIGEEQGSEGVMTGVDDLLVSGLECFVADQATGSLWRTWLLGRMKPGSMGDSLSRLSVLLMAEATS